VISRGDRCGARGRASRAVAVYATLTAASRSLRRGIAWTIAVLAMAWLIYVIGGTLAYTFDPDPCRGHILCPTPSP